jgi:hypothetical protein
MMKSGGRFGTPQKACLIYYIYAGEVRDNTKKMHANTKRNFLHLDSN